LQEKGEVGTARERQRRKKRERSKNGEDEKGELR
jgi:hypothetical protein